MHDIHQSMMVKQIISADWHKHRKLFQKGGGNFLNISEFYYDTIQGEGIYTGHPAAFMRLQDCSMNCSYCDTSSVWRYGSPYTFEELFTLMGSTMIIPKLVRGQHLVFTGGSPLLQQEQLYYFLVAFVERYDFHPFIEVENECVISPKGYFSRYVACWNNSPKLKSCGMMRMTYYQPKVVKALSELNNSWFKFVVSNEKEWNEIEEFYLNPGLIKKEQIILMPEGSTQSRLEKTSQMVVEMAVEHGVRYSDRLHVRLFNKKTGC